MAETDILTLELPPLWRRMHTKRILDAAFEATVAAHTTEVAINDIERAQAGLRRIQKFYKQNNVVFTALRLRPDAGAIDQVTLALPSMQPSVGGDSSKDAVTSTNQPVERIQDIDLDGLRAISHRSLPTESPEIERDEAGSRVQLVFVLPSSDRGAILTIISNASDVEDLLERDAEEIARSVRIISADEVERNVVF